MKNVKIHQNAFRRQYVIIWKFGILDIFEKGSQLQNHMNYNWQFIIIIVFLGLIHYSLTSFHIIDKNYTQLNNLSSNIL